MAMTRILPSDPQAVKAWSTKVQMDAIKDQYFSRYIGPEGSKSLVIRKTDLESGPGDEVTTTLVAKFRGKPVVNGEKLAGREMKLEFATHKMRIDQFRQGVNVGRPMDQKRVNFNLAEQGRQKLKDYISEMYEEIITMAAAGARGVGDEIQQFDTSWTGYPNALRGPDTNHLFVGTDGSKAKATLVSTDKFSVTTVNKLVVKAKKQIGGQPDKSVRMTKVQMNGRELFVMIVSPEQMQDLRDEIGTTAWFEAQKALTTAIGQQSQIFQGGAGIFNGVLIDETQTYVRFNDYGSGNNLEAARALFCGANGILIAHGTKGMKDGLNIELREDEDDRGNEQILTFAMNFGADKAQYNSMDYGLISCDLAQVTQSS